jgi:imidazoleglycerol phosphate dehydratase HisB
MIADLRARMADFYGVDQSALLPVRGVAHGADLVMRRLALDGYRTVVAAPPTLRRIAVASGLHPFDTPDKGGSAVFVQSPNGSTGEALSPDDLTRLRAAAPDALLVVDEGLVDLADAPSLIGADDARLVVLRSVDLAFGFPEDPCGAVIAAPDLIDRLDELLTLDPVPASVARRALAALDPRLVDVLDDRRRQVLAERARMLAALARAGRAARAAAAPFILVETDQDDALLAACRRHGVRVRLGAPRLLRIDIGTPEENDRALAALGGAAPRRRRQGEVRRETLETKIVAAVDLDTEGGSAISTGVAFFDHMLAQVAAHGGFSLTLRCAGDTEVDAHHTIEDCALALGAALKEALGDRRGMARYGFVLPMDEAKAEAAIDLGGRPFLVFEGDFAASHIGQYPTEMTSHVFRSLADSLGAAIHVSVKGENDHHKTEACFKAFGRALRQAIRRDGDVLPSTKGAIL